MLSFLRDANFVGNIQNIIVGSQSNICLLLSIRPDQVYNEKGQVSREEKPQDQPSKLHARRQIMSYLYDIPEPKKEKETKKEYRDRTKGTNHAVVEKLFRELAPKYDGRIQDGKKGGYTRMYKLGVRRGDAAPMVVLELV